jgi:hypothetical protein
MRCMRFGGSGHGCTALAHGDEIERAAHHVRLRKTVLIGTLPSRPLKRSLGLHDHCDGRVL